MFNSDQNIIIATTVVNTTPIESSGYEGEFDGVNSDGTSGYQALQPITGVDTSGNIGVYLSSMFNFAIGIAAALAVLMIVVGGFEYMVKEAVPEKLGAMERIKGAVLGLILALISFLILKTVDEDLVNFDFDSKIPTVEVNTGSGSESVYTGTTEEEEGAGYKIN